MKAAVYCGPFDIQLQERAEPEPGSDQALIKITYAGLCGSDLAIEAGKHERAVPPVILGHEFTGVIESLSSAVHHGLQVGDRVTAFPLISCGECYACLQQHPHVCKSLKLLGIDVDGGFARRLAIDPNILFKLADTIPDQAGAMIEPLAVCVHSVRMSRLKVGDHVVITGAGPIGVALASVARAAGVDKILLTDVSSSRIGMARNLGLQIIDASQSDFVERIQAETKGRGADVLFEASGHPSVGKHLSDLTRIRGQIVQVGLPKSMVSLKMGQLAYREQEIIGIRVYTYDDFEKAVDLTASGKVDMMPLATEVFPLTEFKKAFELARSGNALKVLLDCQA